MTQSEPVPAVAMTGPSLPGAGWPGDPASAATPVATDAPSVRRLAGSATSLAELDAAISVCRACPRLVGWREQVAREKRKAFAGEPYWGRPVPGWGDNRPHVLVVGLAPAAHGGNRTGRIFTGDRSGDWLFAAMHRAGLAAHPHSVDATDGQRPIRTRLIAAVRCAPPENKPTPQERDRCAPWLDAELALVRPSLRVAVALGAFAWVALLAALARAGEQVPSPRPPFGHGREFVVGGGPGTGTEALLVIASFHPSQQNTFTRRLTMPMLDSVFARAADRALG